MACPACLRALCVHFSYVHNMSVFILDVELKSHQVMFEDKKVRDEEQQIKFDGTPFIILGSKFLDCTHGKDHSISKKIKYKDKS